MSSTLPTTVRLTVGGHTFDGLAAGPADGELVLLLHGFPEFADCWSAELTALAAAGYRAVAVDQRGYSPDARPRTSRTTPSSCWSRTPSVSPTPWTRRASTWSPTTGAASSPGRWPPPTRSGCAA